MWQYFQIKGRLMFRAIGIFGCVALPALFFAGSAALFRTTIFAEWIYVAVAVLLASRLSEARRNDFLRGAFSGSGFLKGALPTYRALRLVENLSAVLPFAVVLVARSEFSTTAALLGSSVALIFWRSGRVVPVTIPTPFGGRPFEFCVGFRGSFIAVGVAYFCATMAVAHDNFNLGAVALGGLYVVVLTYYFRLEPAYYVWSFAMSARRFLIGKIKTAWLQSSLLVAPVFVALAVFWPSRIGWLLLLAACGALCVATMVVAKYSSFPRQMGIPTGIVLLVSFSFPPLLLVAFPMFYRRSVSELNRVLG